MKNYIDNLQEFLDKSKTRINESSLSNIYRYVQDSSKSFGIVSAFRYNDENGERIPKDENLKNHYKLKDLIRNGVYVDLDTNTLITKGQVKSTKRTSKLFSGFGFVELEGGFVEEGGEIVNEKSLLISKISEEDLIRLGTEFNQWSVIFKDSTKFVEIGTNVNSGIGTIQRNFISGAEKENFTMSPERIKEFFSALSKGSHRHRKFLFNEIKEEFLYEYKDLSFNEVAYGRKKKGLENSIKLL